jgi:hypothetical protein
LRPNRAPAFPGAEGFGKYTIGGRGGKVFEVTNLNDSGPGSLREAVGAQGPRIVVFRVSGTIALKSPLKIKNPFITIAGQTAPGDGICLKGYPLAVEAPQTVVRYLRSRPGDIEHKETDGLGGGRPARYVIVDHCSASWSTDETFSFVNIPNLTLQWCLSAESFSKSMHHKGAHGYGGIWAGAYGVTSHHNILANNYQGKDPLLTDPAHFDFRPQAGSPLVDAGKIISGITDGFQGKAPDIGAYESGSSPWQAGITWKPDDKPHAP